MGLTGDQGHAEDVVQAAFARAYASWPRVRRSGNPDAYIRQIVINENRNIVSSGCNPVSSPQGTLLLGSSSGSPGVEYGSAGADVQHVVITMTGGRTIRVRTLTAGQQKFFAFPLSQGQHAVHWQAYDGARHEVGSGRLNGPQAHG
jgi:hypothetical protein